MIKVPDKFDIGFMDASRFSTIARCEAKFVFQCLYGFTHPDAGMIALDYGTIMHRVLPYMYSGETKEAVDVFNTLWEKFGYGEEDPKRNTALSLARIMDFVSSHSPERCPYDILQFDFTSPSELISENEIPFLIDIGAIYPFCGRIDEGVYHKTLKAKFAYDFKTSSELSPRYFDGFWFCNQAVGYTIALSQLSGEKIEGIIYEGMRISKTNIETQMGFCYVSDTNIRKWTEEAKLTCARIEAANETGLWRQNNSMCSSYAGFGFPCRVCDYKLLCDSPNWEDAVRFYRKKTPFNTLELEK